MITKDAIRHLNEKLAVPTLSLYLHVDPGYMQNQSDTPAWRIWLKSALRDLQNQQGESEQWKAMRQRLENWIESYRPMRRTLVIFLDAENLHHYELPVALENHIAFGNPDLTPILWAIDEYKRYLITMVDQEQAKFMLAYLGNTQTKSTMTIDLDFDWGEKTLMPATARGDSALREGSNRERFEDMIEAHVDRFHQDVADHIRKLLAESNSSRLVIGGAERAAHNVRDKLHETVAQNLVDILSIPMSASENDIREEVLKAGRHYEREHEQTLVDEVIGFAKAGGRGALGEDEVHRAFTMQQVELLLLPYPPQDPDVAATLTKKALDNNSEIELIHGKPAEALQQEGGVAARLYYSVNGS